ncbi:LysM peptidoglycan-binding domain-containing protein [Mucilaginibacter sp.]|uniref:DPBB and LysM peptidoglycan-binding domain-containing protein n=1 Tax=Mucilaginibacter sp. TaxID=1882438 RepID=UPI003D121B68
MRFKILLITLSLFTLSLSLAAKPLIDSIGVKNNDGKKLILFKVKAKDTYYSIGRRYNIKPQTLMKFNDSKKETLSIGAIVEVPTDQPYKKTSSKKEKTKEVAEKPEKKETKKEKKERLAQEAKEAKEEKKHKHKEQSENPEPAEQQESTPERAVQKPVQVQLPAQPVQQVPQENTSPTMQYKVSAGETLYAISKRFNTTVDDLTKLNSLTSTNLTPGQLLTVRSGAATPQPAQPQPQQQAPVANNDQVAKHDSVIKTPALDSSNAEKHLNANRFGLYEKNEKGVATWIDDTSLDPNKKLVLHRTAPIGTVVKITNPMTNRTTFAKVVGRFTDNESTKDVIIVMTKNVADSLGALDKRFHVIISYGSPNE